MTQPIRHHWRENPALRELIAELMLAKKTGPCILPIDAQDI